MKTLSKIFTAMMVLAVSSVCMFSCSDDDEEFQLKDISLYSAETYTIPLNSANWVAANPLVAKVEGNTVVGLLVGTTSISDGHRSFKVTIKPRVDLYDGPYTNWGASVKSVKSYYKSYYSLNTSPELTYYGKKKEHLHTCIFEAGGLTISSVTIKTREVTANEMAEFLLERYIPLTVTEDGLVVCATMDGKSLVGCGVESSSSIGLYYLVVYTNSVDSPQSKSMIKPIIPTNMRRNLGFDSHPVQNSREMNEIINKLF